MINRICLYAYIYIYIDTLLITDKNGIGTVATEIRRGKIKSD